MQSIINKKKKKNNFNYLKRYRTKEILNAIKGKKEKKKRKKTLLF